MEHFSRYNKPDKKILTEYLLPILLQLAVVGLLMGMHSPITKAGFNIQEPEMVNGVLSSPTVGRLVYLIVGLFLASAIICLTIYFHKKKKDLLVFIGANLAGVMLWQTLGEDGWHFSIGGIHLLAFAKIAALPVFILFIVLLVFFALKKEKNWAMWLTFIVFAYNWIGHFLTEALYALVSSSISLHLWVLIIAPIVCVPALLFSLYLGIYASKDKPARYLSAILTFASASTLIMSIIHSS